VIHALHGEQDMRKMGGLAGKMKITNVTFLLSGLALAGVIPFSGFFSKDEIIASVFAAGADDQIYVFIGVVALVTALVTAIYTGRQYAQVFLGRPRFEHASAEPHTAEDAPNIHHVPDEHSAAHDAHDDRVPDAHSVHESPAVMTVPLIILAIGAVFAGFLGVPHIPGVPEPLHAFANWLQPLFDGPAGAHGAGDHGGGAEPAHGGAHPANLMLLGIGAVIGVVGWCFGFVLGKNSERALLTEPYNQLSLDRIYNALIVRPGLAFSGYLRWFDENVIDGIVHGVAFIVGQAGGALRQTQTSYVRNYALGMALAAVVVIVYFLSR
jgi:NADH-quinone oxidoreductase subunit L